MGEGEPSPSAPRTRSAPVDEPPQAAYGQSAQRQYRGDPCSTPWPRSGIRGASIHPCPCCGSCTSRGSCGEPPLVCGRGATALVALYDSHARALCPSRHARSYHQPTASPLCEAACARAVSLPSTTGSSALSGCTRPVVPVLLLPP